VAALLLILLLPLILLTLAFNALMPSSEATLRRSVLFGAVVWGSCAVAITELLSATRSLAAGPLVWSWLTLSAGFLALYLYLRRRSEFEPRRVRVRGLLSVARSPMMGVFAIFLVTAVVSLVAPPNTWDSMTYHMSRVMHWIQGRSIDFYPSNIGRQLFYNPGAEILLTHLQLLGGSDRFAPGLQWASMVGSVAGVSLIARKWDPGRSVQIGTAVIASSITMGVIQASSTQNDWVVTFWIVIFVYLLISGEYRRNFVTAFIAGGALGLAVLTKGTAYFVAGPFVVWLIIKSIRNWERRNLAVLLIIAGTALLLNLGHYARNMSLYQWPLSERQEIERQSNQALNLQTGVSGIARNVAIHLGTPATRLNQLLNGTMRRLHYLIGVGINDPRTTWMGTRFRVQFLLTEDYVGNPIHLVLIFGALIAIALIPDLRRSQAVPYALTLVAAFLAFSTILKWQPWHSRLQLPIFVLAAPLAGLVMGRVLRRRPILGNGLLWLVIMAAIVAILYSSPRPILGPRSIFRIPRDDQYFHTRPELRSGFRRATDIIESCNYRRIGLRLTEDDWEYPLWALLEKDAAGHRIEHVDVRNKSAKLRPESFAPDVVFSWSSRGPSPDTVTCRRTKAS
jgi:hypothetical protein